jgi:hypothetical protein
MSLLVSPGFGVPFFLSDIERGKDPRFFIISVKVIQKVIEEYQASISSQLTPESTMPEPKSFESSKIHAYLWGHCIRKGVLGKIAGLVYRIMESLIEIFRRNSDRKIALKELQGLLLFKERLLNKSNEPSLGLLFISNERKNAIKSEAQKLLKCMLDKYNEYAGTAVKHHVGLG